MKDLAYLSELKEDDLYHHYHPVLQHLSSFDEDGDLASPADRDLYHSLMTRYHRETPVRPSRDSGSSGSGWRHRR